MCYRAQGRYEEAEARIGARLALHEQLAVPKHPDAAVMLDQLAQLEAARGHHSAALAWSRRAKAAVLPMRPARAQVLSTKENSGGLIAQRSDYLEPHVGNLAQDAARKGSNRPPRALAEKHSRLRNGPRIQWPPRRSTRWQPAWHPAAVRSPAWCAKRKTLPRTSRDVQTRNWLVPCRSRKVGRMANRDRGAAQGSRRYRKQNRRHHRPLEKQNFQDYAALARPRPLAADEVQKLLGLDEALVFFLTSKAETSVFALTREGFLWQPIALGSGDLAQKVAAFRRGLDVEEHRRALGTSQAPDVRSRRGA